MLNPFSRKPSEILPKLQKELHGLVSRYLHPSNVAEIAAALILHAVNALAIDPRVPRNEHGPQAALLLSEALALHDGRRERRAPGGPTPGGDMDLLLLQHVQDMVRGPLEAEGFPTPMECASAMLGMGIRILLACGHSPDEMAEHMRQLVVYITSSEAEQRQMLTQAMAEQAAAAQGTIAQNSAPPGSATKPS